MRTFALLAAAAALVACGSAQIRVKGDPIVTVRPAPWLNSQKPITSIFPAKLHVDTGVDRSILPAHVTLLDNTTTTGFYFPQPNDVMDDANIPDTRDTDGDNIYYITSMALAFFIPADQVVNMDVVGALVDPITGGPDAATRTVLGTLSAPFTAGAWIVTFAYPACVALEVEGTPFTDAGSGNDYDYFWLGANFGAGNCAGGPGLLLASGPDFEDNVFYWDGNISCGGAAGPGIYWFGGNPRASFYMLLNGGATLEEAFDEAITDLNGDGCVNDEDLLEVLFNFGTDGEFGGDTNCDGLVDDIDLLNVLFDFGTGC